MSEKQEPETKVNLFSGDPHPIGSKEWADFAEKGEWAFVAQMLSAADKELKSRGFTLSGLRAAEDIAIARSKNGWRTFEVRIQKSETSGTDTKTSGTL